MYVDNITDSLQGIKTYQGKSMRTGFFMIISHMFIRKSHATIRKAAHKGFFLQMDSLYMLTQIGFLLNHNHKRGRLKARSIYVQMFKLKHR